MSFFANVSCRYMETCRECPNKYPWLGDAKGTGHLSDNYSVEKEQEDPHE